MLSVLIVVGGRRTRTLSNSGAIAGWIVGTLAITAGWSWGVMLLSFFVSASALSKMGERRKAARVGSIVEKGRERDARQVLANGGVFAAAALGQLLVPSPVWHALGAGALAAVAGDTWATEVGTLARTDPISIVSGKRVPAGTSGGVTIIGSAAGVAGALFIGLVATLANWPVAFAAVALGGVAGALADSLLGGTLQARRWCDVCAEATERVVHSCGTTTRPAGGLPGFENDAVNAICSAVGALVAWGLS